jgi:hypothetical protein
MGLKTQVDELFKIVRQLIYSPLYMFLFSLFSRVC